MANNNIIEHFGDHTQFLEKMFTKLNNVGLDVSTLYLDHICYRTSSQNEFLKACNICNSIATLLSISLIGGRDIATYKLKNPLIYKERIIDVLELPAPKNNNSHNTGWEHVEFVIDGSLEEFYTRYKHIPGIDISGIHKSRNQDIEIEFEKGLACKFHKQSLEHIIEEENNL